MPMGSVRVLGVRALNRALLERQMLLRRRRVPVVDAVERLVGLQSQVPSDPYVGLRYALDRFSPSGCSEAIADRRAVRMPLMRATLHLVPARDALTLRPLLQPAVDSVYFRRGGPFRRAAEGIDPDQVVAFIHELLSERPRTRAEVVPALAERWPGRDATSLAFAMPLVPSVQVPPRGLWGRTGRSAFATVEAWLGRPVEESPSVDEMVLRYLRAFGPATPADVQSWSGLRAMREVLERLRPGLRAFRDERGRELFDVPGAPLPDPSTPAPVRFLPEFDNAFIAHDDRARIVSPETRLWSEVGWGTVLVDGFTAARWKLEKGSSKLTIEPFRRLNRAEKQEVDEEAARLVEFLRSER